MLVINLIFIIGVTLGCLGLNVHLFHDLSQLLLALGKNSHFTELIFAEHSQKFKAQC